MIVRIMGLIDIVLALFFITSFPKFILLIASAYLIIKGIMFAVSEDFTSYVDIFAGAYLISIYFGYYFFFLNIILALWLVQKGFVSLY